MCEKIVVFLLKNRNLIEISIIPIYGPNENYTKENNDKFLNDPSEITEQKIFSRQEPLTKEQ